MVWEMTSLVCEAFHGTPSDGQQAAHEDGDVFNDRADNLSWKTPVENVADRERHGRTRRGQDHYAARLKARHVSEIRNVYTNAKAAGRVYGVVTGLADKYGVSLGCIEDIIYRRKWRHV